MYIITNLVKDPYKLVSTHTMQINGDYYVYAVFPQLLHYHKGFTTLRQCPDENYHVPIFNKENNALVNEYVGFAIPMNELEPEETITRFKTCLLLR